ncbi:MAG: molecular chaperone DnaK [Alphaproteobacteria bacterium]|nr:molecular chaperone DnaK [Alphaproteobacteria bacterium]
MGKIIGIDLGTTNSVVAVMDGDKPAVIVNDEGQRTTPSVVGFAKDGERLVGISARRQAVTNPENTVYSSKRLIGRRFDEAKSDVERLPYTITKADNGDCRIRVQGKDYSPPEVSALVLQKLKLQAEAYLGQPVTEAVITVPAYFNDSQRQATKDAGRIAGLEVKRIINEPTAAALAYGMEKKSDETIAVFDLGGGTFDISILEVDDNVVEVRSTNGDTHLGGDDFDDVVVDWLIGKFKADTGIDVRSQPMVLQRLKDAAEKAKVELSSATTTQINLPFLTADASGPKHLDVPLSRAEFERMVTPLVDRTLGPCKKALQDAGLKPADIDEVILVGGSTRIPLVQKKVEELFGKKPNRSVNPDEVVALGAAIQGGILSEDVTDMLLLDVTPLTLGIETLGGVLTPLIERNTTIPVEKSQVFSTAADNQTAVDVYVFQGERPMARDNKLLGNFRLDGIAPAPRGMPQVEVSFSIDANGILSVSAKDKATGKEQKITIEASGGLSDADIQRMVDEAKQNEAADKEKKAIIEKRNELDNMIYAVEKNLGEHGDKLPGAEKAAVEEALGTAREAKDADDLGTVEAALTALTQASHKLAEVAYQQTQGGEPGADAGSAPGGGSDDDIIDAEFEDA